LKKQQKPIDLVSILEKVGEIQVENDEFQKRNMFVELLGSSGLNLIDESKHQQPAKRYLP